MKTTIGRNDLCPCGSGKKYKKCCLAKDQVQARQLRSLETPNQWLAFYWQQISAQIEALVEHQVAMIEQRWGASLSAGPYLAQLREHALLDVGQHQASLEAVFKDGDTPLDSKQTDLLSALTKSYLTCYEVTACRRGEYLTVQDKISGTLHTIQDADLSQQLEPMEAFCGRLITVGETELVLPGWMKLKFWQRKKVYGFVRSEYESIGATLSDAEEMQALLKRRPELILGALIEFHALVS